MITTPMISTLLVALACLGPLGAYSFQDDKPLKEDLRNSITIGSSRITRSVEVASGPEFGYGKDNGPKTWPKKFPTCAGKRQSPINIDLYKLDRESYEESSDESSEESSGESSEEKNRLRFRNYDALPISMDLTNNGHSVAVTGNWTSIPSISGFILKGEYVLHEIHFHWGRNSKEGSEHLVNGYSYPLEMHVVHFKKDYGTIGEAITKKDGLAVLGYFFKVKGEKNYDLQRLLDKINRVISPDNHTAIQPFKLEKLVRPFHKKFASYSGSLTTPLCNQVVRWIVNIKPLHVSLKQLSQFRRVKDDEGKRLVRNFRPPQRLHHRRVIYVH